MTSPPARNAFASSLSSAADSGAAADVPINKPPASASVTIPRRVIGIIDLQSLSGRCGLISVTDVEGVLKVLRRIRVTRSAVFQKIDLAALRSDTRIVYRDDLYGDLVRLVNLGGAGRNRTREQCHCETCQ